MVLKRILHGQTEPCVAFEPSVGCDDVNGGRLEGELGREDQLPVINPPEVRRLFRPGDAVVPLEHVGRKRLGYDVRDGVFLQPHVVHAKATDRGHGSGFPVGP